MQYFMIRSYWSFRLVIFIIRSRDVILWIVLLIRTGHQPGPASTATAAYYKYTLLQTDHRETFLAYGFHMLSAPWEGSRTTAPRQTRRRPAPPSLCCSSGSEICREWRSGESSCSDSLSRWGRLRRSLWPDPPSRSPPSRSRGQASEVALSPQGSPARGFHPTVPRHGL